MRRTELSYPSHLRLLPLDPFFKPSPMQRHHQLNIGEIVATKLCTHVREADAINERELSRLDGASKMFRARDKGGSELLKKRTIVMPFLRETVRLSSNSRPPSTPAPDTTKFLSRSCRAPESLLLKVGAQVMLIKNLDVSGGLANGSRGVVSRFDAQGLPVVTVSVHYARKGRLSAGPPLP